MDRRGRIRLSTMEIVLILTLLGSLVLAFYQSWQIDQRQRALEPDDTH